MKTKTKKYNSKVRTHVIINGSYYNRPQNFYLNKKVEKDKGQQNLTMPKFG